MIIHMDKVLLLLEHKEFTVEPQILQSLQHLTQWVADCAIYLLASLPHQVQNHMRFPGVRIKIFYYLHCLQLTIKALFCVNVFQRFVHKILLLQ